MKKRKSIKSVLAAGKLPVDKIVKGPKALFWYLVLFFTLGITAFSTGGLWFQFINKWFPKEVFYEVIQAFDQAALKGQISALLIAAPVFFIFTLLIRKALKNGDLTADNKVRLWITYIILFLVVAIAIGDLISAIFSLLNGDFTARFLLKSLTILIIVGWIFTYYWLELRSPKSLTDSNIPLIMGRTTLGIIIISFISALFMAESPAEARRKAYDQTVVSNLQEIKYSLDNYYQEYNSLPVSLNDLKSYRQYIKITDPKTGKAYEYRITGGNSYELCADFQTSNKEQRNNYYQQPYPYDNNEFIYQPGRNCFNKKVSSFEMK
ncbi:MAG: hypothetical protein Athens101410_484 [Parcubacteria group bacterium Athens1014_10]|nr:MAG: hypothetical protein Athens101410_484 [Parcubacteria group bacterium Athens1014_10]TSD04878.1 MAG: hypothetical protein Athens071412_559 [Parcubacteria group bacterium Athens0714_12]